MASGHVTALTGRTYGCTDQQRVVKTSPCKLGVVHTWHVSGLAYPLEERSIDADGGTIGAPSMIMTWLGFDICYLITASLSAFVIRE